MPLYKEADEIVINKHERIKFVGATITKTNNPTAWIRRRYTVVCTGVSGQTLTAGTGISIVANAINNTAPNIVQTLTVTGNQISISGGNTQTLPAAVVLTAGTGISIVNNAINNTAPNVNQNLGIAGQQLSISGGNTITLPAATPTAPQTLGIAGQQLSISGGNTITLPPAVAPPASNIYNTNGSIPVNTTRTITVPSSSTVADTRLVIDATTPPIINLSNPTLEINAVNYNNLASSNFILDVGTPSAYVASPNNAANEVDVLCYQYHAVSKAIVVRKINLGIASMPQIGTTSPVSQKRKWINGKEEKVYIGIMTLENLNATFLQTTKWTTPPLLATSTIKAHKITLFDSQERYLEAFHVRTEIQNGFPTIKALVMNPDVVMYNANQSGGQLQAIIYYTE